MASFKILSSGPSVLRIEDPPVYWVATFVVLLAVVCLVSFLGALYARVSPAERGVYWNGNGMVVSRLGRGWRGIAILAVFCLGTGYWAWCVLQTSSLTLDRGSQTYSFDDGRVFFVAAKQTGSLDNVAYATIETDGPAQRFVVVFRSGARYGLGAFTDQGNQSEAAAAVNRFLGVSQSGEPTRK